MIISVEKIKNILEKIDLSQQDNLFLSFTEIDGFKFVNNKSDLQILEDELNNEYVLQEYISIKDISKHLNISKPTVIKLLKLNNIDIVHLNAEDKVLKSEYIKFLINAKNKKSED